MKTSFAITKYAMQEIRPTIKFILFYFILFYFFSLQGVPQAEISKKHM